MRDGLGGLVCVFCVRVGLFGIGGEGELSRRGVEIRGICGLWVLITCVAFVGRIVSLKCKPRPT